MGIQSGHRPPFRQPRRSEKSARSRGVRALSLAFHHAPATMAAIVAPVAVLVADERVDLLFGDGGIDLLQQRLGAGQIMFELEDVFSLLRHRFLPL